MQVVVLQRRNTTLTEGDTGKRKDLRSKKALLRSARRKIVGFAVTIRDLGEEI